jgi:hypothetical protein
MLLVDQDVVRGVRAFLDVLTVLLIVYRIATIIPLEELVIAIVVTVNTTPHDWFGGDYGNYEGVGVFVPDSLGFAWVPNRLDDNIVTLVCLCQRSVQPSRW